MVFAMATTLVLNIIKNLSSCSSGLLVQNCMGLAAPETAFPNLLLRFLLKMKN